MYFNNSAKAPPPQFDLSEIVFIHNITVGSINPQVPFSDEEHKRQLEELNKCLSNYPKGKIIGRDIMIGTYHLGEHQLSMQKTTYHIGFKRKPHWIEDQLSNKKHGTTAI